MNQMTELDGIALRIRERFDVTEKAREHCLALHRELIRTASLTIRALHRHEGEAAEQLLARAANLSQQLGAVAAEHPQLHYAGYVQDAQKEYAEAALTLALVKQRPLPSPEELGVEDASYLNGLGEAVGELRRFVLDLLRRTPLEHDLDSAAGIERPLDGSHQVESQPDHAREVERLLDSMDGIYSLLTSMDYPDALTRGLRRTTDVTRGIVEKTRGDLTSHHLVQALGVRLRSFEQRLRGPSS
jgi:translin